MFRACNNYKAVSNMQLKKLLFILNCIICCFASKYNEYCNATIYNVSDWDCNEHKYHFMLPNLQKTLFCIGYDGSDFASKALNKSEPSKFQAARKVKRVLTLDVETTDLIFFEMFGVFYKDDRLKFHRNDCLTDIEYPGEASGYFAPIQMYQLAGIELSQISVVELARRMEYIGIPGDYRGWIGVTGHRQVKIPCNVDLRHYPFDTQKCEVDMIFEGR